MARLTISLLGAFEARLEGAPVAAFDSNKVRALLAYLAVESARPHSREALAALLWPEFPDRAARTNLRNALANLRKAVGDRPAVGDPNAAPPALLAARETIQFNADGEAWLDVAAFRALSGRAVDLSGLEEALDLYRGPFLDDLSVSGCDAWEAWRGQVREQLEREALKVLERLAAGYADRGELARAIGHSRRLVDWAPWREEGHRQLMRLLALGGQRGAALAHYEACRQALRHELDVEPDPETVRLYEQIRAGKGAPRARPAGGAAVTSRENPDPPRGILPAPLTPFVGREGELAGLGRLLADPSARLVTVVGPGGCGKTRLALEAAAAQVDRYPRGAWFVSLAALHAAEGIVPAIAQALGFPLSRARAPRQQLLDYLRQKQMLLLLDNCEHLLAGGEFFVELLHAAPGVRLLVTSRVRLDLQGEYPFELAGMSCPPEGERAPERLAAYSAAALFISTAQRARPGWAPQGEDGAHIARLCRQVEGMPLALLLAAAWVDTLSPAEIARRVARDLDFLETAWRDVPERQRSMRAVCDASWRLLTESEQAALAALSTFRGSFTAEAAQAVGGAGLRTLRALVHKSFLQVTGQRYGVHELLRQYAREQLDRSPGGGRGARERHAAYYLAALARWAAELKGPGQRAALAEMELELGNLQAAWESAVERGDWAEVEQAAEGLALFYDWRGRKEEARILFRHAAERLSALVDERTAGGPEALCTLLDLLAWQGYFEPDALVRDRLAQRCQELLALPALDGHDVRRQKALLLRVLPRTMADGKTDRARALLEESLALYRSLDNRWAEAVCLLSLGLLMYDGGRLKDASQLLEQSVALFRALREQNGIASCLHGLQLTYGWQGRFKDAERVVEERMALAREWGDLASLAQAYLMLCSIWPIAGRFTETIELAEVKFLPILEELGDRALWAYGNAWLGHYKLDSGDYGAARAIAERSLAWGREMNNAQAISAALPVLAMQALLEERYQKASELYRETLAAAEKAGYHLLWTYYGGEWAAAELRLGRRDAARQCLRAALQAAVDGRMGIVVMRVLPSAALWLAAEGQAERAVELYALAMRYGHIAHSRWHQDVFGPAIAEAAASLPPEVVVAAQARGRARDLAATVRELLAELEG